MKLPLIIRKIKELFSKKKVDTKYIEFVEKILPSLKFGDIIYAERFNSDIEKEKLGEDHSSGPFVVVSVDNDKIVGAYLTSSDNPKYNIFQIGMGYKLFQREKKSYLSSNLKTIDYIAFKGQKDKSLNYYDCLRLKKRFSLNDIIYYDDFGLKKELKLDFNVNFDVGDVVGYENSKYLIISKKDEKFEIIPFLNQNIDLRITDFSNVKMDNYTILNVKENKLKYYSSMSNKDFYEIEKEYERSKKANVGDIVKVSCGLYYIYDVTCNVANSFFIEKKVRTKGYKIKGREYELYFDSTKSFDIDEANYELKKHASDEEKKEIELERKEYLKTHRDSIEIIRNKHRMLGKFVCLQENESRKYFILGEEARTYTVLALDKLKENHMIDICFIAKSITKEIDIDKEELELIKKELIKLNEFKILGKFDKKEEIIPKEDVKKSIIGNIVCSKLHSFDRYIICGMEGSTCDLISLDMLLLKNKIKISKMQKKFLRELDNITSIELKLIRNKLEEKGKQELSKIIEKKIKD